MLDLTTYQGLGQFGRAYQIMLENSPDPPCSVEGVWTRQMIRLCPETVGYLHTHYTPTELRYERGSRPELEQYVRAAPAAAWLFTRAVICLQHVRCRAVYRLRPRDARASFFGRTAVERSNGPEHERRQL